MNAAFVARPLRIHHGSNTICIDYWVSAHDPHPTLLIPYVLTFIDAVKVVLVMHLPCDFEKKVRRRVKQSRF